MLPLEVLQEVQSELLDLQGSGMSILEMSHRAPIYEKSMLRRKRHQGAFGSGRRLLRALYGRRRQLQFSMVPMNFWGLDKRRLMP